jgi:hypothetical protein
VFSPGGFFVFGLIANNGVSVFTGNGTPGVNDYAVTGTAIDEPGFFGGFAVGENPADFVLPLRCDKGGIFEYFEYCCYVHFFRSVKKIELAAVYDGIMGGAFCIVCPEIRSPVFRLFRRVEVPAQGVKVSERNKRESG